MRKGMLVIAASLVFWVSDASAQQNSSDPKSEKKAPEATCPMHDAHSEMNKRGEKAMGFSQSATSHHFFLNSGGGVIQVEANNPADTSARDEIRAHLNHIAQSFQNGDFDIPMFVHDTVPPGVPEMKRRQKNISYSFHETPNGGRILITASDKQAIEAIHQFLIFQIEEHKTGDPEFVPSS